MPESWWPLLRIGASQCRVGIRDDGQWVVERADGELGTDLLPLLPVLEGSRSDILQKLHQEVTRASLPTNVVSSFPLDALVHYALRTDSAYWQGLALEWAAEDVPLSRETGKVLTWVATNGTTQSIRHRALRLLRKDS